MRSRAEHRAAEVAERRSAGGAIRAAKKGGEFTALAVTYGRVDDYGSVWLPGCFNEHLAVRLPQILFGHDWMEPIGRATGWRDTAEGLEITARLDVSEDVPKARQAAAQLASGTLSEVSVGFFNAKRREPTTAELKRWPGCREVILKADLDELSIVVRGAVPGAAVTTVRSAELARALADGRITPSRYREEMAIERRTSFDLDADIDAAVALVRSRTKEKPVAYDPVQRWTDMARAELERKEAEAERRQADREREQKAAKALEDKYGANPFAAWG